MQNISTPLIVVAVALIDGAGSVMMQRRRLGSMHGGLWEFPGGKLEAGESAEAGAAREIEEELAILIESADLEPVTFASGPAEGSANGRQLVILLYACRRWRGTPVCRQGEEIAWFALPELAELPMPPLDYPLARGLNVFAANKSS